MHSTDAAYRYRPCRHCVPVFVGYISESCKTAEPIEMRLGEESRGSKEPWRCTLAPPGDAAICQITSTTRRCSDHYWLGPKVNKVQIPLDGPDQTKSAGSVRVSDKSADFVWSGPVRIINSGIWH